MLETKICPTCQKALVKNIYRTNTYICIHCNTNIKITMSDISPYFKYTALIISLSIIGVGIVLLINEVLK